MERGSGRVGARCGPIAMTARPQGRPNKADSTRQTQQGRLNKADSTRQAQPGLIDKPTQSRQLREKAHRLLVQVRDNNVDQALKALKKKMQREGIFREMKLRNYYEKP